ncbi:MAG: M56 family metallopeptidase [Janthinobacterium lividum]
MGALLVYLLKANVVLALFALAYYGLLRRLTFFGLNRVYLLLALGFAAVYPVLPVPALLPAGAALPIPVAISQPGAPGLASLGPEGAGPGGLLLLAASVYALGTALLLLRLLGQLLSLALVHRRSRAAVVLGQPVRVLPGAGGPFSFGRTIYLSAGTLADAAGLAAALRHEQAHVRQHHTLDVLLTQLATALAWPNPAAWLLRRAVLDNLEYLADRAALRTGLDRRAYQYSLLRQQPGGVPAPALAFHFSFLTLKNRITMLNQPASTARQLGRYLLAAPLLMLLALGYSCAQKTESPTPGTPALNVSNAVIYIDGQRSDTTGLRRLDPKDIASINVVKGDKARALDPTATGPGIVFITTEQNKNRPDVVAFNAKQQLGRTPATLAQKVAKLPADAAYFLNGKPSTREAIAELDSTTIVRTNVVQGKEAAEMAHDEKVKLAIAVIAN